jgi:FtsK/SpoIIIE family
VLLATALHVRDVQAAILRASVSWQGDGLPATILLNRLFHEVFAALLGPNASLNFHAAIGDAEADIEEWRRALIRHSYQKLFGPRLHRHQAVLHHDTDHVLNFWDATQEMCHWLADLLWHQHERGDEELTLAEKMRVDHPFVWEIREPDWRDAVQLTGGADGILQIPGTKQWCVVELKMGLKPGQSEQIALPADLAYACLYHHLLLAAGERSTGALALVTFGPQHHERLISAAELALVETDLKSLIGRLAGVAPDRPAIAAPTPITKPHDATAIIPEHTGPVLFSQIRTQLPKPDPLLGCSKAPLGVDGAGQLRLIDFAQPEDAHLLLAGMAGSGKTEWLRAAIAGLILTNTPATLRLLIIDSKRSAFDALRNSPFLLSPIIHPDEHSVAQVLSGLGDEMDRRYKLLDKTGQYSLTGYIQRKKKRLARIFCICDEYADLIGGDRKKRQAIELQIVNLGQKARAVGIHLILATGQTRREIMRGALDSNIPARIGMKMQKATESKMLLNYAGAENLAGRGDLLFKDVGEPVRLQGAYLPEEEAAEIFS